MSKQAVRAGGAFVEIGAKTGLFDSALAMVQAKMRGLAGDVQKISSQIKNAGSGMASFGKSTMGVGAAIAGLGVTGLAGMVGMTKQFADAGSAIDDMSQRTGLAAEEVSGLGYAALMSGTSIEAVEKAIRKMQASGAGAGDGAMVYFRDLANAIAAITNPTERATAASEAFGKSGSHLVSLMNSMGEKDGAKYFVELATNIAAIENPLERASAATKAFGQSGSELLPLIDDADKVEQALHKLKPMGFNIDAGMMADTVKLATEIAAIEDPLQRASAATKAFGQSGSELLPMLGNIATVKEALQTLNQRKSGVNSGVMAGFLRLATSIAAIEDPSERAAAAIKAFGKSGTELLPMLADGGEGIKNMMREAESLGLIMRGSDAKAAAELGDSMDKLWKVIKSVSMSIGASLAPTLLKIVESIVYAGTIVRQFLDDHREWVVMAAKVGAVVALVGGALVAFGATVAALGLMMAGLGAAFTMAASVVGAILSPIGLVIVGVASLGAAIAYQSGAIGTALEWIQTKWQELLNFVIPIIEGIKNALVQGKWAEAGQIAMLGLQVAFRAGLEPIYGLWTDLQTWLISNTVGLVTNMANVFAGIPTALMNGFSTTITWLTGTWDQTVNYIAKKLLYLYSLFDSSVNYEQAAAQMDKDAAQRAAKRQKELDAATASRSKALDDANQGRLAYAQELTSNVRQDAAARKEQFGTTNASLREELRKLISDVNESVPKPSTEPPAREKRLEGAKATGQTAVASLPGSAAESSDSNKGGGTFSGFAAGMLGNQSPLLKMVEVSKKSLEVLTKIEANTSDSSDLVLE